MAKRIPLINLEKQYSEIKSDVNRALGSVIKRQSFILGKETEEFERKTARYCGTKYGVGVNSGTDALFLALKAMGVKEGDEVITTPFTFIATAEAIVQAGARPVFVDIDPVTYNMDPDLIEKAVTKNSKVILAVHIYGLCSDMNNISRVAREKGLLVLEDCAQAIGSLYNGKKAGSMGDAAAISFFPSKNLGCFGDGGMVVTGNRRIYDKVRLLRNHGSRISYYHEIIGYNSRLDNIQAAVLKIKLNYLEKWLKRRIENATMLNSYLAEFPIQLPEIPRGCKHTFHLYVARSKKAGRIIRFMNSKGIDSRCYYPIPLHLQKCFKYLGYKRGDFRQAEKASKEVFNIPVYPELTKRDILFIRDSIKEFFRIEGRN